jgi:hypothetical protein
MNRLSRIRRESVILPVAAFVALAGTGFGVWVFDSTQSDQKSGDFEATDAVGLDGLTLDISGNRGIVLDQKDSGCDWTIGGTVNVAVDFNAGVVGTAKAYKDYTYDDATYYGKPTLTYSYGIDITITGGLEKYIAVASIKVGDDAKTVATSSTSPTATAKFPQTVTDVTVTDNKKAVTATFAWNTENLDGDANDTMKPSTKAQYDAMVKTLSSGQINIVASVSDAAMAE